MSRRTVPGIPSGPCAWPRCPRRVRAGYLMCAPHWYRLPAGLRARIWAAYRRGQTAVTASPEYLDALREALGYATAREAGR
jgi:hypothetical protein